ncbi:hypothetical protein I4U23_016494 [Adineta vaga]|nr:hypothetical protein I4U23_016494 [Adineta vaga]
MFTLVTLPVELTYQILNTYHRYQIAVKIESHIDFRDKLHQNLNHVLMKYLEVYIRLLSRSSLINIHPNEKWSEDGLTVAQGNEQKSSLLRWVVAGGQESASNFNYLAGPEGVVVDQLGNVYVADRWDHQIVCWPKGNTQGNVIVGKNRRGERSNQLSYLVGLSFDRHGNLYIVDNDNNRIQKFQIEQPTNS